MIRIHPRAYALMLKGLTADMKHETLGYLVGLQTEKGPLITGAVFPRLEEYSNRSGTRAVAVPRGVGVEEFLVPGEKLLGVAHTHPGGMDAFHSSIDDEYLSSFPDGSVSIVVGKSVKAFQKNDQGKMKEVPFEICWNDPSTRSILEWQSVPAVAVHEDSLKPFIKKVFFEEELRKIAGVKAYRLDSWILYVRILGLFEIRTSQGPSETFKDLSVWLGDLLGFNSFARIRIVSKIFSLDEKAPIRSVPEFSCLDASLEFVHQ